jgi:hypothetical protein
VGLKWDLGHFIFVWRWKASCNTNVAQHYFEHWFFFQNPTLKTLCLRIGTYYPRKPCPGISFPKFSKEAGSHSIENQWCGSHPGITKGDTLQSSWWELVLNPGWFPPLFLIPAQHRFIPVWCIYHWMHLSSITGFWYEDLD